MHRGMLSVLKKAEKSVSVVPLVAVLQKRMIRPAVAAFAIMSQSKIKKANCFQLAFLLYFKIKTASYCGIRTDFGVCNVYVIGMYRIIF